MTHRDEDEFKEWLLDADYCSLDEEELFVVWKAAYDKGRAAQKKEDAEKVPINWLDPLLSGKDGIKIPASCPDIEKLLRSIKKAIEESGDE